MANLSERIAPIGLVLALGFGPLHSQSAAQEGQSGKAPQAQGETEPAPPILAKPRSLAGMNLDFTQGAKLGEVFLALSRHSGVSILLHSSVAGQETSTTADLGGMNFKQALDILMLQNDLFYKVLDPTSVMVFKRTPQNLHDFETKLVRTFQLANTDVDSVRMSLNAFMPAVPVSVNQRLNAVTVICPHRELGRVQEIVNNLDRAGGEVALRLELIEVSHKGSVAAELLPMIGATAPGHGANRVATDQALARVMQDGGTRSLARAEVRVLSGKSAEVRIGGEPTATQAENEAKPLPGSTTSKSSATGLQPRLGSLGWRIKVNPKVIANEEITLVLDSEITDPPKGAGPGHPNLSDWVVKTSVRMKSGETLVSGSMFEDMGRDGEAETAGSGKDRKDCLLVVKAFVVHKEVQ